MKDRPESYSDKYRGKKILITGGLGFIGSNLAIRLVKLKAKVLIIDSLIPKYGGNWFNIEPIKNKVRVNISDIRDRYSLDYLVRQQEIIFNLAGTLSHVDSMTDPFADLEINCVSQLSILEACRKNNPEVKIIFAGTRNQYGKAKYLPVNEKHPLEPTDINGINNLAGEWYHLLYNNVYGIRTCSLRMTNTFGPRHQMKHPRQGVLNWFIRQIIDREEIKLWGSGKQIRDTNYIDDVVEALLLVGTSNSKKVWGQAFNLGGTPISLEGFVQKLIKIAGKGRYRTIPYPPDKKPIEIGDYIADWNKIKNAVGWQPKVSLDQGIKKTLRYYQRYQSYYWTPGIIL